MTADTRTTAKRVDIQLLRPLRVGETILPPGRYVVRHCAASDGHVLVFRQREARRTATYTYLGRVGPEVARIPCHLVPLSEAADRTAVYTTLNRDGTAELRRLTIRGERVQHVTEEDAFDRGT